MDKKLQENLLLLADTLLPLNKWLQKPGRENLVTPWRDTKSTELTAKRLSLICFIEQLISDSDFDENLAKYWDKVEKNPLAVFSTLSGHDDEWRTSRDLDEKAVFGIVKSENVEVALDNPEQASSRREFYGHAFELFLGVLDGEARFKNSPSQAATTNSEKLTFIDWITGILFFYQTSKQLSSDLQPFVVELLEDKNPAWPNTSIVKSSHFIKQFTKDLFYALMGMRVQPPNINSLAVLIEAGEHRRVGNSYSVEDVRAAVAVFDAKLKEFGV